jgi:hypothetical protein
MSQLILQGQGQNFTWPGFSLLGESSLAITLDDTGAFQVLDFLVLSGTTSVGIGSDGLPLGENLIHQLVETTNDLTTVTIRGSVFFDLGSTSGPKLYSIRSRTVLRNCAKALGTSKNKVTKRTFRYLPVRWPRRRRRLTRSNPHLSKSMPPSLKSSAAVSVGLRRKAIVLEAKSY